MTHHTAIGERGPAAGAEAARPRIVPSRHVLASLGTSIPGLTAGNASFLPRPRADTTRGDV